MNETATSTTLWHYIITILSSAVIASIITGSINIYLSKKEHKKNMQLSEKNNFSNVITSERKLWVNNIRNILSEFMAEAESYPETNLKKLYLLRNKLFLFLFPKENSHKKIMKMVDYITVSIHLAFDSEIEEEKETHSNRADILRKELLKYSQILLKTEWDIIKKEIENDSLTNEEKEFQYNENENILINHYSESNITIPDVNLNDSEVAQINNKYCDMIDKFIDDEIYNRYSKSDFESDISDLIDSFEKEP
ncbi:hypothetical protein [Anaerosphaera multitolerans]|uniref:Uncharacterized protein n=1 Tax=Anaerosphaera multitolerans TaxID=2487351 RepID=A0A437S6V8_9FIRM|nr:hypothetical protein [Anaerosphaera multitolerans]RVU54647.1 hypothetical protein EF514_05965 [Anaerosphaera multitolerans]